MIIHFLLAYLFAVTHELCHYLVAKIRHVSVEGFSFWLWGTGLQIQPDMESLDACIISLAGPLFHGIMLLFLPIGSNVFRINLAMLMVNLLPALPLDGGRILKSILFYYLPISKVEKISCKMTFSIAIGASILILVLMLQSNTVIPLVLFPLFLFLSVKRIRGEDSFVRIRRFSGCARPMRQGDWFLVSSNAHALLIYPTIYREKENLYFIETEEKFYGLANEKMIFDSLQKEGSGICFRKILRNVVEKETGIG